MIRSVAFSMQTGTFFRVLQFFFAIFVPANCGMISVHLNDHPLHTNMWHLK